ncbi:hypothetical protein HanXRQr2_Chr09g0376551 [Helianthus annuus]|uniref:Uncharacterized protein n=1 Tax=Helianthus annuus TaxID=4232 RepID=A0A9K3N7M2_HELAN|nr:hypothetical protein HanXRQr2_Chr09g0376551 [Helianthus annuus]
MRCFSKLEFFKFNRQLCLQPCSFLSFFFWSDFLVPFTVTSATLRTPINNPTPSTISITPTTLPSLGRKPPLNRR